MVRLSKRNNKNLKLGASASLIGAGISAGVIVASGGVGMLAGALMAIGGTIASLVIEKVMKKSITRPTIDDYLGTVEKLKAADEAELSKYDVGSKEYTEKEKKLKSSYDDRLEELRKELMGELGYVSKRDFLKKILREQGEQLIDMIFKDKNGNFVSPDSEGFKDHREEIEPYIQLVQSFGCKVRFGKNLKDSIPSLDTLVKKMN